MANWKHLAVGATGLAAAAGLFYALRSEDLDVLGGLKGNGGGTNGTGNGNGGNGTGGNGSNGSSGNGGGNGGSGNGGNGGGGVTPDNVGEEGAPPGTSDDRWGNVPLEIQQLLIKVQNAADIPYLWVMGAIIAQGEAGFIANAHNQDSQEVAGSRDSLKNGIKRGNPKPKYADQIQGFGSGGLFGALSPYFHWIGLDEGYMPFLKRAPELVFDPAASGVFMAHYFWRITMPSYAKGRTLTMFDARVGWGSPTALKKDPFGKYAGEVRGRMRESIQVIGWDEKWVESLPIVRTRYRGIQSVAPAMGFSPSQED